MISKIDLAKEIGFYFGTYFEENNQLCIDNGENIFRYADVDALLIDWLDTIILNHHDNYHLDEHGNEWDSWEKEIVFIYTDVIGKLPDGIRFVDNKKGRNWQTFAEVSDRNDEHKTFFLGMYSSIVDAIFTRKEFMTLCETQSEIDFNALSIKARDLQLSADNQAARKEALKTDFVTKNLITAMINYGSDAAWTDSDIIDALISVGITYTDFEVAGYGSFVKEYFDVESEKFKDNLSDNLFDELKSKLFLAGNDAIEDFLNDSIESNDDKDTIAHRLDIAYAQMPEDVLNQYYEKYHIVPKKTLDSQHLEYRVMKPSEQDFAYTQEQEILVASGCIGHLRVDMGSDGYCFFSSWDDHQKTLKSPAFVQEFDTIIDALRFNPKYQGMLANRESLKKFCQHNPNACIEESGREFGFRVDSAEYSLMVRLNPHRGEYAAYIYAYDREILDCYLQKINSPVIDSFNDGLPKGGKPPLDHQIHSALNRTSSAQPSFHEKTIEPKKEVLL